MLRFRSGGIIFALLMILWRGPRRVMCKVWTVVLRRALSQCGTGTIFAPGVYIDSPKRVSIGAGCYVGQNAAFGSELSDGRLIIADHVQVSENCGIDYSGGVQIGEGTLISPDVRILSHDHGYDPRSEPCPCSVEIGANVWIGVGALILPGTRRIGDGAIIGAGAIVTHPVPDGAIMAGNPARIVKYRQHDSATRDEHQR